MNETFLMVLKNDREGLARLLRSGANPNIRDDYDRTPIMRAAKDGKDDIVGLLIQSGADVNLQDKVGFSALHFAAQDFRLASAEALLTAGANVDLRDSYGNTPLGRAVVNSFGRGEMIKLLLKYGADPMAENNYGNSPFGTANTITNYDIKQFFT
jgi:uncharacterized protein